MKAEIKRGRQVSDEKTAGGRNKAPRRGAGELSLIQLRRRRKRRRETAEPGQTQMKQRCPEKRR